MGSETGALAVLAGLPGMGPRRLRALLAHFGPQEAVRALGDPVGLPPDVAALYPADLRDRWRAVVRASDVEAAGAECARRGIRACRFGSAEYPVVLLADPVPPAVLFWQGDLHCLQTRRVAIVGTRSPTRSGLATAGVLGQELAEAGVAVVSGLARGIDAAAHHGVLSARGTAIAVVGNGLDQPYPKVNSRLWEQVAASGLVISEWPPGVPPDAYRFPMRNRILAALSEVVVVVESRESGGSLSTVRAAMDRGITVMAVPGSVHSRASAGTNRLLCEGAPPVASSQDVLVALGLHSSRRADPPHDPRPAVEPLGAAVLNRCRLRPQTLDDLCQQLQESVGVVALALARLERDGWVAETGGWWEVLGAWETTGCHDRSGPEAIPYGS